MLPEGVTGTWPQCESPQDCAFKQLSNASCESNWSNHETGTTFRQYRLKHESRHHVVLKLSQVVGKDTG